jgi:hypothetical protein
MNTTIVNRVFRTNDISNKSGGALETVHPVGQEENKEFILKLHKANQFLTASFAWHSVWLRVAR